MKQRRARLHLVAALAGAALAGLAAGSPSRAAELLFVERSGCPYCAKWEREIAPIYSRTEESRRAPLRKVSLDDGQPAGAATPVRYTPTFLLMDGGREIARITGYIDASMFWGMLSKYLERLTPDGAPPPSQ